VFFNEFSFYNKYGNGNDSNNTGSNVFFLKKEVTYTKLKYSRVPQADIVSGGIAAFLAAFLGYIISERFGFELIDSGDFYFLVMYLVVLLGSLRFWFKSFYKTNLLIIVYPITNLIKILAIVLNLVSKKLFYILGK